MSQGILVGEKEIGGKVIYDSRNPRLQVAIDRNPKHLDIKTMPSGTALVTSVGNNWYAEETLLSINHGLKYRPKVLVYIFVTSTATYGLGKAFYAFGAFDDYIGYRVNSSSLDIIHVLDDTNINIGVTSTAPNFISIRVKYLIFSNPLETPTNA